MHIEDFYLAIDICRTAKGKPLWIFNKQGQLVFADQRGAAQLTTWQPHLPASYSKESVAPVLIMTAP